MLSWLVALTRACAWRKMKRSVPTQAVVSAMTIARVKRGRLRARVHAVFSNRGFCGTPILIPVWELPAGDLFRKRVNLPKLRIYKRHWEAEFLDLGFHLLRAGRSFGRLNPMVMRQHGL